jgi:hypothetical protein
VDSTSGFCRHKRAALAFFLWQINKEKARPTVSALGFSFVDKRFEISNHGLIRDMDRIIQFEEDLFFEGVWFVPVFERE